MSTAAKVALILTGLSAIASVPTYISTDDALNYYRVGYGLENGSRGIPVDWQHACPEDVPNNPDGPLCTRAGQAQAWLGFSVLGAFVSGLVIYRQRKKHPRTAP